MATLYAQSTGNWDAINWNTAANGSGSNQTPAAADTVVSNGYTVTVNGTYTCVQVTNTSGGTFSLENGSHLTCTHATAGVQAAAANAAAVTFALSSPGTATLVSSVVGGSGASSHGITHSGTGTLTINGKVTGGSYNGTDLTGSDGVYMPGAGGLVVNNGSDIALVGGKNGFARALNIRAASTVHITGDVVVTNTNYSSAAGIYIFGAANVTLIGNVTGGTAVNQTHPIHILAAATLDITGNLIAQQNSTGLAYPLYNTAAATITITGNLSGATLPALYNNDASAVITVKGTLTPGSSAALQNTDPGAVIKCTGPFLCSAAGVQAVYSPALRWYDTRASYMQLRSADLGSVVSMYTAGHASAQSGQPATTNVRSGTAYGPVNELTGTLAVPAAGAVACGVAVDHTVGTAVLRQQDVAAAVGPIWAAG